MLDAITQYGITGRAYKKNLYHLRTWNPRDYTSDRYHKVDDAPYGGGAGMVMMVEPLDLAISSVKKWQNVNLACKTRTIYLSPQGKRVDHDRIIQLASMNGITLICGRYEGIDERFILQHIDEELSIGDYVISGGELAAMVLIDSIIRQLPGALGDAESADKDSLVDGLLEYPQYTRPEIYREQSVPRILLTGDHAKISRWRLQQSLGRTWLKRPDLLIKKYPDGLPEQERLLLEEFKLAEKNITFG